MAKKLSMADLEAGPGHMVPARFQDQSYQQWCDALSDAQVARVTHHAVRLGLNLRGLFEVMPVFPVGRAALSVIEGGAKAKRGRVLRHRTGKAVLPKTSVKTGEGEMP